MKKLLNHGYTVIGYDNINDYYDPNLKTSRLNQLGVNIPPENNYGQEVISSIYPNVIFVKGDLRDKKLISRLFSARAPNYVVNLAAQAGVRYSLTNPEAYLSSNIEGFLNILEACRHHKVDHLVYASSSSVYGLNETMPFRVSDNVDHPISLYAASKKSNELMAHAYSHLYNIPTSGLRFFTVYGPWGRPDMALFLFTKAMLEDQPINVFNNGEMIRDFTYVDDIVEGIKRVLEQKAGPNPSWSGKTPDPSSSSAPYRLYNIGNQNPVNLMDFIRAIENELGLKAKINYMPMQPGDVAATQADVSALKQEVGYQPNTSVEKGINRFIKWYLQYYQS